MSQYLESIFETCASKMSGNFIPLSNWASSRGSTIDLQLRGGEIFKELIYYLTLNMESNKQNPAVGPSEADYTVVE